DRPPGGCHPLSLRLLRRPCHTIPVCPSLHVRCQQVTVPAGQGDQPRSRRASLVGTLAGGGLRSVLAPHDRSQLSLGFGENRRVGECAPERELFLGGQLFPLFGSRTLLVGETSHAAIPRSPPV